MSGARDRRWMTLALSLGRRGMGRVWPNPAVGCVIVQGDRVVGRGWTADGGRPHAETQALAQAGAAARGADVYVTLEPCAHHGVTPPCAAALVAAGVGRVVVACGDPDPRVAGRGIDMLRAAGITVETGVMEAEARADHAGFLLRVTEGRPFRDAEDGGHAGRADCHGEWREPVDHRPCGAASRAWAAGAA